MTVTLSSDVAVFVPAKPMLGGAEPAVAIETRRRMDGTRVAVGFRSMRALVEALGEFQPWVCLPMAHFRQLAESGGVAELQIDPRPDSEMPEWAGTDRWTRTDLLAYAQAVEQSREES